MIVPYANFDQRNHSPNENIEIDYFLNGITCTCHVIHALGAYAKHQTTEREIAADESASTRYIIYAP